MAGYVPAQGLPDSGRKNAKKKKKKRKASLGGGIWDIISGKQASNYLFKPQNQASKMAEAIEAQAASQKRQAEQKQLSNNPNIFGSGDPYQSLQDELFSAINSINIAPTPLEQLQKMANQQVGAQYDPMIAALNAEMGSKKKRGARSQKEARAMYGGLAKDFLAELPALTQEFAAEDKATNARYDTAQAQMDSEYDKQSAEQEAVMKRLGVQAAMPEASQQARDDQAYFQNQMEMDQQAAMSAQDMQQESTEDYQRNLGSNARMAGENTAQDIGAMLEDYLTQAGSQMTGLKGQKSSAIAALLSQMQQQDAQNVQQQRQQEIDNMMGMFNFQLNATKAGEAARNKADNGMAESLFKGTSGRSGAANFLASKYPDQPILAKNLMEQLNDVLSNKQVTQGKFILDKGDPSMGKAPRYSDVGQQYMEDLLRREFEKEGNRYSVGNINDTMDALLAYLGKLR